MNIPTNPTLAAKQFLDEQVAIFLLMRLANVPEKEFVKVVKDLQLAQLKAFKEAIIEEVLAGQQAAADSLASALALRKSQKPGG